MKDFKHLIITRFNLPRRWDLDKKGNNVLDKTWLEERFDLFENFCLPSIESQTNKNFEWWVVFDKKTPQAFLHKIRLIEDKYSFFKPKYEHSYDDFDKNLPERIRVYLKQVKIENLITTRLDNDDMLAKDSVALIQDHSVFDKDRILEMPVGYTLEMVNSPKIRKVRSMLNPFISFVEIIKPNKAPKTVYYHQHTDWTGVPNYILTERAQWVQLIHEKNLCNRPVGELVFPINFKSRFNFKRGSLQIDNFLELTKKSLKNKIKRIRPIKKWFT